MTVRYHQGHRPRHRRRPDRVHSGVVHRASAAGAALLRLRRRGVRQDLRDADPVRRDPGAAVDLFRPAVAAGASVFSPIRRRGASSSACCWRSCRRRWSAQSRTTSSRRVLFNEWMICFTLIAGGAVLLWIDMLDLKPRYHDAQKFTLPMYFIDRRWCSASRWSRACRARARPSSARCCSAPTAARPRSSRSGSRCRPWPARSPTISTSPTRQMSSGNTMLDRRGLCGVVHRRLDRGEDVPRLRAAPRLRAVRVVARDRRLARTDRAGAREITGCRNLRRTSSLQLRQGRVEMVQGRLAVVVGHHRGGKAVARNRDELFRRSAIDLRARDNCRSRSRRNRPDRPN